LARLGFCDPTSLFVFTNPFSSHEKVREFFFNKHADFFEDAKSLFKNLSEEEKTDFSLRLSAYAHEKQHFHDFLLTRTGSRIVRASVLLSYNVRMLFEKERRSWRELPKLPLKLESVRDSDLLAAVTANAESLRSRVSSCRQTLECSAMLVQRLGIWDGLGRDALASADAANMDLVYHFSRSLDRYADLFDSALSDLSPLAAMRTILVRAMMANTPDTWLASYLSWLDKLLLMDPKMRSAEVQKSFDGIVALQEAYSRVIWKEERKLLTDVLERSRPEGYAYLLQMALMNYFSEADKARKRYLESWIDYVSGVSDSICEPYHYWFSEPTDNAWIQANILHHLEQDGERYYEVVEYADYHLVQARILPVDSSNELHYLDKATWQDVAREFSGSRVLLDGPDWSNPVKSYFIRHALEIRQ
jgi:hypothetical protein